MEFYVKQYDLQNIANLVCDSFGIEFDQILKGSGQKRKIVEMRRLYSYISKSYTNYTWEQIGSLIGLRHSTIIFHCRKFEYLIDDKNIYNGKILREHFNFVVNKLKKPCEIFDINLIIYNDNDFLNLGFTSLEMAEKWLFFLTEKNINVKMIKNEKTL